MHVTKLILVLLLASPALAAETAREDAALQKARRDLAQLEHQLKGVMTRATRSARATAADAQAPFAPDRRSLVEDDGYLMCEIADYAVTCGTKLTQATCDAETDCAWVAGEGCGLTDEVASEIGTELMIGTLSLIGPLFVCAFSTVENCPAETCYVYGDTCTINDATVDAAFEDESIAELSKMSTKCSSHWYEDSCVANEECKWALPETDAESPYYDDSFSYFEPTETCSVGDDAYDIIVAKYCEIDSEGGYSPASSAAAGVADAVETGLLGAALAAGLAALA